MKKGAKAFLDHILTSIELIEGYVEGKSLEDFMNSIGLQDQVIRRLEIIGEAVKNLPNDLKSRYPAVPWKQIAGMRDVMIHKYFGVDIPLVWKVVKKELPKLKAEVIKIAKELEGSG